MAVVWYEKNPGATEAEIRAFEEKEQIVLPESYKAFLREMDGGRPLTGHSVPYVDERFGRTWMGIEDFYGIRETIFTEQLSYLHLTTDIEEMMEAMRAEAKIKYGDRPPYPMSLSIVMRNLRRDDNEYEKYFPYDMLYVAATIGGHEGIALRLGTEEVYLWFDDQDAVLLAPTFTDFLDMVRFDISNEEADRWEKGL